MQTEVEQNSNLGERRWFVGAVTCAQTRFTSVWQMCRVSCTGQTTARDFPFTLDYLGGCNGLRKCGPKHFSEPIKTALTGHLSITMRSGKGVRNGKYFMGRQIRH